MGIRRLAWWTALGLNAAVPAFALAAAAVALNTSGNECNSASTAQHVASWLVGATTVLLPTTLLLDLIAGAVRRHRRRWRRLTTVGAGFCVLSAFPLLIATLALSSVCW
jgi:hypothetical protein